MHDASEESSPDPAVVADGRAILLRISGGLLGITLISVLLAGIAARPLPALGRLAIIALLCLAMFRGAEWARRVTLWVLAFLTIGSVAVAFGSPYHSPASVVVPLAFAASYGWVWVTLARTDSVKRFMAAQRAVAAGPAGAAT